jgi:hypothetical protein
MDQKININANINFQPYINQIVASNLVVAYFTGKRAYPDMHEKDLINMMMEMYSSLLKSFEEIPVRVVKPKQ